MCFLCLSFQPYLSACLHHMLNFLKLPINAMFSLHFVLVYNFFSIYNSLPYRLYPTILRVQIKLSYSSKVPSLPTTKPVKMCLLNAPTSPVHLLTLSTLHCKQLFIWPYSLSTNNVKKKMRLGVISSILQVPGLWRMLSWYQKNEWAVEKDGLCC